MASTYEQIEADLFWADLMGPQAALYDLDPRAESEPAELFGGLRKFVRKAVSDVGKTAGKVVSDVGKGAGKAVSGVGKGVASAGKVVSDVGKAVPVLSIAAKLASHSPLGMVARSSYGALSAALRGQNIGMGALDGLAGSPIAGALVKAGISVARGENLVAAAKLAVKSGISDARDALRFAAMVAPFVPGIGTGVGAALGAADALASGQPITAAVVAGVRGAIPGGAIAQTAFDTGFQLASGKRIDQALLTAARNQLPPGPAQAAFDTSLAIAQGKKLQQAALAGAGALLPPSPYAADVKDFARRALAGDNLGKAALSVAGQSVLRRANQLGGDLVKTAQGQVAQLAAPVAGQIGAGLGAPVARLAAGLGVPRGQLVAGLGVPGARHAASPGGGVTSRVGAPAVRIGATAAAQRVPATKQPASFDQILARAAANQRQVATRFMVDLGRPAAPAAVAAPAAAPQLITGDRVLDRKPLVDSPDHDLAALFGEAAAALAVDGADPLE
jgi:hypothetical protein